MYRLRIELVPESIIPGIEDNFMSPKHFCDYVYFRVTELYFKWDGKSGAMGPVILTFIQCCILGCFVLFAARYFYSYSNKSSYSKLMGYMTLGAFFVLYTVNYAMYNGKYQDLKNRWKDEPETQRMLKGLLILLLIVIPFIALMLINSYVH